MVVAQVNQECYDTQIKVDGLKAGKVFPKTAKSGERVKAANGYYEHVYIPFADAEIMYQKEAVESAIYKYVSKIRAGESFVKMMLKVALEYHGKPLVEVTKPLPPEPILVGEKRKRPGSSDVYEVESVSGGRVNWKITRLNGVVYRSWIGTASFRKLEKV